jgi:hypothetical protein
MSPSFERLLEQAGCLTAAGGKLIHHFVGLRINTFNNATVFAYGPNRTIGNLQRLPVSLSELNRGCYWFVLGLIRDSVPSCSLRTHTAPSPYATEDMPLRGFRAIVAMHFPVLTSIR